MWSALFPMAYPEGGFGGWGRPRAHPPPLLTDLTLVWGWNSYIDRIVYHFLTGWFFLMKRALQFATKLNSKDIKKCNCFWVPSYGLLASARKAVFPTSTATGVHRLRNTWSSLWEVICHKKVQQPFLNQSLDPLNPKSLDPPLSSSASLGVVGGLKRLKNSKCFNWRLCLPWFPH